MKLSGKEKQARAELRQIIINRIIKEYNIWGKSSAMKYYTRYVENGGKRSFNDIIKKNKEELS